MHLLSRSLLPLSILLTRISALALDKSNGTFDLNTCLSNIEAVYPSDADWAKDSEPFNLRLDDAFEPIAIVYPASEWHVSTAVKCAAQFNVSVSARSGGHSYAAYGLGGENGHLIVSLDKLANVTVIEGDNAKIGGGARLGNVALELWNQGKRAMPHGTCAYVGVGGHFTMGGFGLDSRLWGLALDQIQSMQAVLANGTVVTVSESQNSDLFWAIRGAGPSFAIVTEFTVKTYPAPAEVHWFSYTFNFATPDAAARAFEAYQAWGMSDVPKELGPQLSLNKDAFLINGAYYGPDAEKKSNESLAFLWRRIGQPISSTRWTGDYIHSIAYGNDGDPDSSIDTTKAPQGHDTFYVNSLYVSEDSPLPLTSLTSFFTYLYDTAIMSPFSWFIQADLWGGHDSVISSLSTETSSFLSRNALYGFQVYAFTDEGEWPADNSGEEFVQGFTQKLKEGKPADQWHGYPNYVDPALSASEAHAYYYGTNVDRLNAIKKAVDPKNVLTFPQAFGRS